MVINIVREVLARDFELNIAEIDYRTNFQDDLALDSVMFIALIIEIESRLGVKIPNNIISEITTARDLCNLVERLKEGSSWSSTATAV